VAGRKVTFVVVPFLPEHQPALGVSSLSSVLQSKGFDARVLYLNLSYRQTIGNELYYFLSRAVPAELLIGEMIFARALWGGLADWEGYVVQLLFHAEKYQQQAPVSALDDQHLSMRDLRVILPQLRALHWKAQDEVQQWTEAVIDSGSDVIGFTTTFQQNIAALALAKRLKDRLGSACPKLLFGGANCEGEMGRALAEQFDYIDAVVSGESETIIAEICQRGPARSKSVFEMFAPPAPRFIEAEPLESLDVLPVPSYDDYFQAIDGSDLSETANLVAEASRGCWWGMKSHCKFCGLNGTNMRFRSKSPSRFVEEVTALSLQYGTDRFLMADNILDIHYLETAIPELIMRGSTLQFFFETKSNLRQDQIELLAAGGVLDLQPGIESLSTQILTLMGKGTSSLQNIQLLKWAVELGVSIKWNFLYGFPGEECEEYRRMAELIPQLAHLIPPSGCPQIRLDRFSPYFRNSEQSGMTNVREGWAYEWAYPSIDTQVLSRLAYFFEFEYKDGRDPRIYAQQCVDAVADWNSAYYSGAKLEKQETPTGQAEVLDWRDPASTRKVFVLSREEEAILEAFDSVTTFDAGKRRCLEHVNMRESDSFSDTFEKMLARKWIIQDHNRFLSVVTNGNRRTRIAARRTELQLAAYGLASSVS
jgi:ribosomal peptide maturation radical SAM protein 1